MNFSWYVNPIYHNIFPVVLKHIRKKGKNKDPKIFWEISYEIFIHIFSSLLNVFTLLNLRGIKRIHNIIEEVWKLKENAGVDIWSPSPKYPAYFEKVLRKRAFNLKKYIENFSKLFSRIYGFYSFLNKKTTFLSKNFYFPSMSDRIKFFIKMGEEIVNFWYSYPENNPVVEILDRSYSYKVIKFKEIVVAGIREKDSIIIYDSFSFARMNFLNRMKTFSLEEGLAYIFLSISGSGVYEGTTYSFIEK